MSGRSFGYVRSPASRHIAALLILALLALSVVEAIRPVSIPNLRPTASFGFTEYFSSTANPINITQGPDGRIYYVGSDSTIDAINLDGTGSFEYGIPSPCPAHDLTSGPDAAIWFTEPACNRIGRMTPSGTFTEYPMPDLLHGVPWDIVQGADLNLWFTLSNRSCGTGMDCSLTAIGRIKPADGSISIFVAPSRFGFPSEIALGTDGNIWFAEPGTSSLGRALPDGTITDFPGTGGATQVAAGADGRLWFSGGSGNTYGVMTLTGAVTMFSYPIAAGGSYMTQDLIGPAPDGNVWFSAVKQDLTTVTSVAVLGNISPTSVVQDFPLPPAPNPCCARLPAGLAIDSLNRIWYTDTTQTYIGHTDPLVASVSPTPTPPSQTGGGSPSTNPPSSCQQTGHPINCATGEMWHRVLDLSVPGRGLGLWLVRTYSTTLAAHDGPLGFGWTHGYNMSLTVAGDGSVTVYEEGGSAIGFAPNGGGGYSSPTWVFATLTRNADGTYTLQRKNQTSFMFNSSGSLVQEQDRNGHPTTLSYSNGQLTTVTDSSGRQLQFQYSGSRISKITDPIQRSVAFQYDGLGNLVSAADVAGGITRFSYDANHLMVTMTDPNGGVVSNTYDAGGRVVSQSDAMNRTTSWAYGAGTATITDRMGHMTNEVFQNGQLVSLTKGFGTSLTATWTMTYDPKTFTLASSTDPNNHTATMVSDANGNFLSITDPLSRKWTFSYDTRNDLVSATDPMGVSTQFTYDSNGNPTGISHPTNGTQAVTTIGYDASNPGDAISLKDPDGNTFHFAHDQFGNVSRAVDALGNVATFTYDGAGRLIRSISPNGGATAYAHNAFGDVLNVTDPLGNVTSYQYDANRNVIAVTDANGHTSRNVFDLDNEQLNTTRADGSQVRNVYNADGQLSAQIDGLGHATTYGYDAQNRLATMTDALNRVTTIGYDAASNRVSVTDAKGQKTTGGYDTANQLTTITYSDGKTPNVSYQYDGDGRRTSMSDGTGTTAYAYDSAGRLIQSVNGSGAKVGYGYDLRGDLTRLIYPDGSQVARTFDANGRMATVTESLGHTTSFAYDANGNLITEKFPNGVRTNLSYDAADRLTKISDTGPQGQIVFTEGRDSLGQLTSESIAGAPPNGPVSYGYDQVNRLTSANYGIAKFGYQYDAANRMTQTTTNFFGATVVSSMSYDNADQLLSLTKTFGAQVLQKVQFTYDANGNRVQKADQSGTATNYGYDQANRLTSYGTVAQYAYNGDGLRMSKTVTGVTEPFVWDLVAPVPILIQDGTTRYVTGPDGLPLEQISANGTIRYYHQDALGSTRALTNAQGKVDTVYLYDPYGNTISASGSHTPNPFQFAGQYTDAESGFQYLNARYYDPSTANFLTRDPANVLSQAAYSYGHDSPLNYADPSGLGFGLSGVAQWFWDNAGMISTVFGILGFIFSESVVFGAAFDVISTAAGFAQGIQDITKGEPWWKIAWDFAGPIATFVKLIGSMVKVFATLLGDLKEGQVLAESAKNAVRAAANDFDVMLLYDRVATLANKVSSISDTIGNVLMFVDIGIKALFAPPAAAPTPTSPGPQPVQVPVCP